MIHVVGVFRVAENIVELEICVFDELGNAVHSEFTLMDHYLRVGSANTIDFSTLNVFLLEQRSLADADT